MAFQLSQDVEKFTEKGSCPLFGSFTSAIILDVAQQQTVAIHPFMHAGGFFVF